MPSSAVVQLGNGTEVYVRQRGAERAPAILFLHGWPQDGSAWDAVTQLAEPEFRCLGIDLPGIGRSSLASPDGDAAHLADIVHELIERLELHDVTLVGHDIGGMITFAYLTRPDAASLRAAVIMDTAIPGVAPWDDVLANPHIWHFAFHGIPELPERLVRHEVRAYLDYFFDTLAADPAAVGHDARERYARSYSPPSALRQGFEFYRSFRADAAHNRRAKPADVPTLYARGEKEPGELETYASGLREAGIRRLTTARIRGAGHFAPEEAPAETWAAIRRHLERVGG